MPIKFRCQHCRQFLGIAKSKAGLVVDCPTCGRSLRVPQLNGKVEPLPELALDLQDASLARALDELAAIGEFSVEEDAPMPAAIASVSRGRAPTPQIVSLNPLPAVVMKTAPVPIATAQGPSAKEVSRNGNRNRPTQHSELSQQPSYLLRMPGKWLPTPALGLAFFAVAAISFALGYLAGSWNSRTSTANAPAISLKQNATVAPLEKSPLTPASVKGRILYETEVREHRPDQGARLLFLPLERVGLAKLPVTGFRAADSAADRTLAVAAIHASGGELALVDAEGAFEATLPGAGNYEILVLSHYQSRDPGETTDPRLKSILEKYFERPEQLLGRVAYHAGSLRYSGTGTKIWDHTFSRP